MMNHDDPGGNVTRPSYVDPLLSMVSRTSSLLSVLRLPPWAALYPLSVTTITRKGPWHVTRKVIVPPLVEVTSRFHLSRGPICVFWSSSRKGLLPSAYR